MEESHQITQFSLKSGTVQDSVRNAMKFRYIKQRKSSPVTCKQGTSVYFYRGGGQGEDQTAYCDLYMISTV